MNPELLKGYYLGDWLVEPLKGQVSGRKGSTHLAPKAAEVLNCLANAPGEIVSRDALLDAVWGVGNGSQEALSHAVSEIRHALDDHADNPVFIQTLPKRGYRLLLTPEIVSATTSSFVLGANDGARPSDIGFIENLKHRGVIETLLAYLVVGWLLIQIADIVFDQLHFPEIVGTFVTVLVIAGLPIALVLSWFLDIRDGRTVFHDASPADARRRRFSRTYVSVISALGMAGMLVFLFDQFIGLPESEHEVVTTAGLAIELPPIVENSIAVLPFYNIDNTEETQIFANGLHEDIINRLTRIPDLRVSSRGDSATLAPNSPSKQVRERLRVQMYLEGSVQIRGDQMRITVQMIDTESGFHIVSRTFDPKREDFFVVRDDITRLTVANIRVALPPGLRASSLQVMEDPSLDAYLLYRRGIDVSRQPTSMDTISSALGWFDAALQVDPEYAAAHAGKCTVFVDAYGEVDDPAYITRAQSACATALTLNPNLDIVHTSLGELSLSTGRLDDAESSFKKALAIDPSNVAALLGLGETYQLKNDLPMAERYLQNAIDIHPGDWNAYSALGGFLFQTGRFDEAATRYQYVVALNPEDATAYSNLGAAQMFIGNFAAAEVAYQRAINIQPMKMTYGNLGLMQYFRGNYAAAIESHKQAIALSPQNYLAYSNLGDALWVAGRRDEAKVAFLKADSLVASNLEVNPNDPYATMDLAWIRAMLGRPKEARDLIDKALKLAPDDPYTHYYDGLIHIRAGDDDKGIESLTRAAERGYSREMLAAEPLLEPIRPNPRFAEILTKS